MNLNLVYSAIRFVVLLFGIVLSLVILYYTASVTYPFIIAFALAFLINPVVTFLEKRWKIHRGLSVIITLLIILSLFAGLITVLIAEMVNGFIYLADVVPENFRKLVDYLESFFFAQILPLYHQLAAMFDNLDPSQRTTIIENIQSVGSQITAALTNLMQGAATGISRFIVGLPNFATVFIFSLLATFFISKDWYRLSNMFKKLIPEQALKSGGSVYTELRKTLIGFIKAQATLISITAVIVLTGLLILRVDYAITIALIIGLVDLLPYLGTGLVFVPWIVYNFFIGNYFLTIGLSVLYGIVIVQRQIMEPKILSSNIGLDPLATLIALFVGFKLFGFLGLIIGPVLLVVGKTLHQVGVFKQMWGFVIGKNSK